MKKLETLGFKHFCMSVGNLPSSYVESLSYYECLMWLCKYLQDTVIPTVNNNGEAVTELQNLFLQLQQYVKNYFENLDVQEEINNKLDELVEDGTLETMIGHYIYNNILGSLNFRTIQTYESSLTDEYQGNTHEYLQGFCKTGDNTIIMGLVNPYHLDNIVKLVEYNISTGSVLRSTYLELNHCNSIAYNNKTKKLYVCSLEKKEDGEVVADNTLFEVDYTSLSITNTYELSNLSTYQLRSVSYDEDENQLYGASTNAVYKIDLLTSTISDVVDLDMTNIQPLSTNQIIKKFKGYYIGLNISNIIVWNLDGSIFREINIDRIQENLLIGEVEDYILNSDGDIIVGTIKRLSEYKQYRTIEFKYSNIYTNTNNVLRTNIGGIESSMITVNVDVTSNQAYEDGTTTYPFKDLQKAINYITNSACLCKLNIKAGEYSRTLIRNVKTLTINAEDNVIINGLTIENCKVLINNEGYLKFTGIKLQNTEFRMIGLENNKIIIDSSDDSNYGRALACYYSTVYLRHCNLVVDDNDCVYASLGTNLTIEDTEFTGYVGHYAINSDFNNAIIKIFNNIFNESSSATQHQIYLGYGTKLYTQNNLNNYNDYVKGDPSAKIYGVKIAKTITGKFLGDVDTVDHNYSNVKVKFSAPSYADGYYYYDVKTTNSNDHYLINCSFGNNVYLKNGLLTFQIKNDKITVSDNRKIFVKNDGTIEYEQLASDGAGSTSYYAKLIGIEYYDD